MTPRDAKAIDDEAVQWFVALQDDEATDDDRARFEEWRAASPEHDRAWREVNRLWSGLDLVAESHAAGKAKRRTARPALSRRTVSAVAGVALVLAAAWQLAPPFLTADFASGPGERRIVRLEDGSQVELGAASALDVDYRKDARSVRLLSGEAFFTVARDPARPFTVAAENGRVRVLGTAFNVKIGAGVTVAVSHNTVDVSAAAGPGVRVTEGETVHYDENGVSPVEAADLTTVGAWRNDQLVFRDTPLDEVLAELRRYRRGRIELFSRRAGEKRVTAVFDARRTDEAIDTIAASLGLRVYRATSLFVGLAEK